MSRSHTLIAGPLFLAAALASHASAAVVINMVDDGADIRVTVTGWFNAALQDNGGTTQYGADIHEVTNNDLWFVELPAGVGSVTMKNYTNTAGFSGDFEGSTLYDSFNFTVTNSSLPIFIKGFSSSWTIAADPSATEANPYDWDVRYENTSLAAKGYKVGTYVWTLTDAGANTDSLTLNIGSPSAVPGAGLAGLATIGLAGISRRRRR